MSTIKQYPHNPNGDFDRLGHDRDQRELWRAGVQRLGLGEAGCYQESEGARCPRCNVFYGRWNPVHFASVLDKAPCSWSWDSQKAVRK